MSSYYCGSCKLQKRSPSANYLTVFGGLVFLNILLLLSSPDLKDLVKNEKTFDCSMDTNGLAGEGSPRKDKLMSKYFPAETSIPLEEIEKRDDSFSVVSCNHQQ